MYEQKLSTEITQFIWQRKAPTRADIIVWFLAIEKLKTGAYLLSLNLSPESQALCPLCDDNIETSSHLFFTCRFARRIWSSMFKWWGINGDIHEKAKVNIEMWSSMMKGV